MRISPSHRRPASLLLAAALSILLLLIVTAAGRPRARAADGPSLASAPRSSSFPAGERRRCRGGARSCGARRTNLPAAENGAARRPRTNAPGHDQPGFASLPNLSPLSSPPLPLLLSHGRVQVGLKLKFSLSEVVLAVEEPCIAASHSAFWLFVSLELWLLSDADYCRYDARERSDGGCCCASLVQSRHWMCAPAPVSLS
jgi:hypothetical protein